MAEQKPGQESLLGDPVRACGRRRLVWPDALSSRVEVHRSVHYSAPLRALRIEQVSPSSALLFLSRGARGPVPAMVSLSGGIISVVAAMALAKKPAARSLPGVYLLLDCGPGDFLLFFRVEANCLHSACAARGGIAGGRASYLLSTGTARRPGH